MIKLHSDTHFSEIIIFLYLFMSVNILTKIKKIWGGMPQHSTFTGGLWCGGFHLEINGEFELVIYYILN